MQEIIYYSYYDNKPMFFREDEEIIFTYPHSVPYAILDTQDSDNIWYSYNGRKPIAFEECRIVYDWLTRKPLYYIEKKQ